MQNLDFKNERKKILIADDELINREILSNILESNYDVLMANDGVEAINIIQNNLDDISLILLDIIMPNVNGIEVLQELKDAKLLSKIPVIVLTSDFALEEEALTLGAADFISKPYPRSGVILARVRRIIELYESRQIINDTERDTLTKLYNIEYFRHYIELTDLHYKEIETDAIIIDINRFHFINERYGTKYGNELLIKLAKILRLEVSKIGGMVCRREADLFYIYVPHINNPTDFLNIISHQMEEDHILLKMGIYQNVDKKSDIAKRFEYAKSALENIKKTFTKNIGYYDNALHDKELYEESLIEDFQRAIKEKEFVVYYQPKFSIQGDKPVITSAEALVRWRHKTLGMISPGVFIPLFEEKGLIGPLDRYVWDRVGYDIANWKKNGFNYVPVSVNVSRVDIIDSTLVNVLEGILKKNDISHKEFILEITESAYMKESSLIISRVKELRNLGFCIEMDDFGTGYSSLNMISELPIDVLKLDMVFVRQAFKNKKDTKIIELLIDLANYLSVKVVAEGVETEEQYLSLKELGCDIVQGYYFSKPIPEEEYIKYIKRG